MNNGIVYTAGSSALNKYTIKTPGSDSFKKADISLLNDYYEPVLWNISYDRPVDLIVCGQLHVLFISQKKMFAMGDNSYGQCGAVTISSQKAKERNRVLCQTKLDSA